MQLLQVSSTHGLWTTGCESTSMSWQSPQQKDSIKLLSTSNLPVGGPFSHEIFQRRSAEIRALLNCAVGVKVGNWRVNLGDGRRASKRSIDLSSATSSEISGGEVMVMVTWWSHDGLFCCWCDIWGICECASKQRWAMRADQLRADLMQAKYLTLWTLWP
jgi:hypothetical protein